MGLATYWRPTSKASIAAIMPEVNCLATKGRALEKMVPRLNPLSCDASICGARGKDAMRL